MIKGDSRILSWATILCIYFIAFLAVYFLYPLLSFHAVMMNVLAADMAATAVIFTFSVLFNNSSVYDPYWSVVPPVIVIFLIKLFPGGNCLRQSMILILVCFWSLRLTVNWFRGWQGFSHQDWRYSHMQDKSGRWYWPVSFFGIHMMPTLIVFSGCLPLWYALTANEPINVYDIIAALFTFAAIMTEWIADEQLMRYRKKGFIHGYIKTGLWAFSRHPNYLGEIGFWAGLFLFVLSSSHINNPAGLWTILGLVFMIILFTQISIPIMEKRNLARRAGYQEYVNKVPVLIPRLFTKTP